MQVVYPTRNTDGLRLLAVSRIPRCSRCPRLAMLQAVYRRETRAEAQPLPPVPSFCSHTVCRPLVDRMLRISPRAPA